MKKKLYLICVVIIALFSLSDLIAQQRIGVYDSRAIAIWNFNSPEFQKSMMDLRKEYNQAIEKKDSMKIKELSAKGPLIQRILHDKGFGRGSVAEIIEAKKDVLKTLAESEKLIAIVSKWEVNYASSDVVLVDVTLKLLDLLKAPENVIKTSKELMKQEPIKDAFFLED